MESAGPTLEFLPLLILEIFASEIDGGRTLVVYSTPLVSPSLIFSMSSLHSFDI